MSDWEVVNNGSSPSNQSDWSVVPNLPNSEMPQNGEGLGMSALKAIPRVGEDLYRGAMGFIKDIPGYYQSAKTQIPGAYETIKAHPSHAFLQALAGSQELINNLAQLPRNATSYAENRLNLLPKGSSEFVGKISPPDTTKDIHELFGEPKYAGEELIRGVPRNALNLLGLGKAASVLNPMNLTAKSIAKDVLRSEKNQISSHNKLYNSVWDEAEKTGFNKVPVNEKLLSDNLSTIEKYKTPKDYKALEDFIISPSLENAQKAQSDMGVMRRKLEEKSRSGALTSEEQSLYKAAKDSEHHIESNMFKNSAGKINDALQDKYRKITKSYRENVVPYRYNENIQKFKAKEMLPEELVNSLSRGEFAAKKGSKHKAIKIRNALPKTAFGVGSLGGLSWILKQMFGNNSPQ